jgi:hypothetical protein
MWKPDSSNYNLTGYGMVVADGLGECQEGIASRTALTKLIELVEELLTGFLFGP